MFIYKDKRINIDAPFTSEAGVVYGDLRNPEIRQEHGILEIPEPEVPADYSDETYYRTEQDDAPYVIYTKKSDEQLAALRKSKIQAQIDALEGYNPMARPTREFMLLITEKEAIAAGVTLEDLRASHYGYRKVKELDEQIAALRSQL